MKSRIETTLPPDSPEQLLAALRRARILSPSRLHHFACQINKRKAPVHVWAAELVDKGWLTKFQARQLLGGRGSFLILGPYVVLEPLGVGGMGHVFKARHRWMKREVALKIISAHPFGDISQNESSSEGFELFPASHNKPAKQTGLHIDCLRREAQAAARVAHPHFITAYDAGRVGSIYFLVMEYVEGVDLERVVRWTGPLPISLACSLIRQAASGLQHLHECGFVHRDIKPTNLLLAGVSLKPDQNWTTPPHGGILKILDFGLARKPEQRRATESFSGTPDFVAPEVAHDSRAADIRSDLYSLGCTFYFLLTGQVPYPGGSWTEKLLRHHLDPLTSPEILRPEIPLPVVAILQRLLSKNPVKRYQAPMEVVEALSAIEMLGLPGPEPVELPPEETRKIDGFDRHDVANAEVQVAPTSKRVRSKPLRFIVQIGLAILLGIGLGLVTRHWATVRLWAAKVQAAFPEQPTRADNSHRSDKAPILQEETRHPFVIERSGRLLTLLKDAITEAIDGDSIVIDGGEYPIAGGVDCRGKALTLKAASNVRPILQFFPLKEPRTRQSLLTHDRPLTLEGLDLVLPGLGKMSIPSQPLHLIYSERTRLQMSHCRVAAAEGHSPITCRGCSEISLQDCDIMAGASALCLEVSETSAVEIQMADCRLSSNEPDSAAIVLWATETISPSTVHLKLERNHVNAGRILSLARLPADIAIHAFRNQFQFRQAIVSYTGMVGTPPWEKTAWTGGENSYQGSSDWMCINGAPAGICGLAAWQDCWKQIEPGSSE